MYIILKKKQLSRKNNFVLNQYLIVQNYSIVYYFFAKFLTNINFLLTSHSFLKIMPKIIRLRYLVENQLFGVCSRLGERLNFSAGSIRIYFIYVSFFTFGSPIIIYIVLAFWMEVRKHLRRHKNPTVWEF
jgi:phage shock protein C